MSPLLWLKPVNKFVLEVVPVVCVVAIGGYMAANALNRPSPTPLALPAPASADLSGEEVTAIIQTAHSAALASRSARADAEPAQRQAAEPQTPRPHKAPANPAAPAKSAALAKTAAAPKPAAIAPTATLASAEALPPPAAAEAPEKSAGQSWYGRTWGAVSDLGVKVVHTTRLDAAADLAVATPGAVARVSKRAIGAVADAVLPGSR